VSVPVHQPVAKGATASWLDAGTVDEYELGRVRIFPTRTGSIGVVRTPQGFFAVRNRCPHQAADICAGTVLGTMLPSRPHEYRYDRDTPVIRCPLHRWEFRLEGGESIGGITSKRLVTYAVELEDERVYVKLRKDATR
jgi:3-phenylpropionate/trans-cinnamate dioxygenase ferredoxin subunit